MRCYTYGVFDLLHYGHIRALKEAKKLADELIIGVYSDEMAEFFKRKPVLTQEERIKNIEELGLGKVILQEFYCPPSTFLKENKIDIVAKAEGAGWSEHYQPYWEGIKSIRNRYENGI